MLLLCTMPCDNLLIDHIISCLKITERVCKYDIILYIYYDTLLNLQNLEEYYVIF